MSNVTAINSLFKTHFQVGMAKRVQLAENDNDYYDKRKSIRNKLDIISGHYGQPAYVKKLEELIECICDDARMETLEAVERGQDRILKEIAEE